MWNCALTLYGNLGYFDDSGPMDNEATDVQPEALFDLAVRRAFENAVTEPQPPTQRPQPRAITKRFTEPQPDVLQFEDWNFDIPEEDPFYPGQPSTGSGSSSSTDSEPEVDAQEEVVVCRPFCSSLPSVLRCSAQENGHKERLMMRMRMANFIRAVDEGKVDPDAFVIPPEEKAAYAGPQGLYRGPLEPHRPFQSQSYPFSLL